MTSNGDMSAARMTTAFGGFEAVMGDLRRDLTTSLTPRRSVLCFDARIAY